MSLKQSIIKGMAWTIAEKIGTMLFQMCASFLILRILNPNDYAVVAFLTVFTSLCTVIVDGGFNAALLRKQDVSQNELTSVFAYNIVSGILLYFVLLAVMNPIIGYYGNANMIGQIAPVFFLVVPISALINIQTVIFSRRLDFKSLSRYTLWASLISSAIAVGMVYAGFGLWTIVLQRLTMPLLRAALLWINSKWTPSGKPGLAPLKNMASYSASVFTGDFLNALLNNVPAFLIPRLYGDEQLGFFNQAQKNKDVPVQAVVVSMQGVTLPSLAKIQDDPEKLSGAAHKIIAVMNFLMFPVMVGLIAIAEDMVSLVGAKWMPMVPYFKIFCLTGLLVPLQVVGLNIMKIKCSGKAIFRYELLKKGLAAAVLAFTIPMGIEQIVWGLVIIFAAETLVNAAASGRYAKRSAKEYVKEFLPYLSAAALMFAAVRAAGYLLAESLPGYMVLAAEILTGVIVYIGLCAIFRPEAWREAKSILAQMTGQN